MSFLKLKSFIEENPMALAATEPLKDGAAIQFHGTDGKFDAYYVKEGGCSKCREGRAQEKEMTLTLSEKSIELLTSMKEAQISDLAIWIMDQVRSRDVKVQFNAGFLTLFSKGYFGVVAKGGSAILQYLAKHGFGNILKLKRLIAKFRG
jgi:hypothetical protein